MEVQDHVTGVISDGGVWVVWRIIEDPYSTPTRSEERRVEDSGAW